MRRPAARIKPRLAKNTSYPAPVHGWIANATLATGRRPDGTKVLGAQVLENWFPTGTGIRMRRGSEQHAVIGTEGAPVTALFSYHNGNNQSLFAANASAIYDISAPVYSADQYIVDDDGNFLVDDDGNFLILNGTPATEVSGFTGGDWSVVQFATSGGVYLRLVNGVDTPQVYDGSAWGTSPTITGSGLAASDLRYVWAYKSRLFFIEKDSLNAWYLPVDNIGGTATKFPLGGVFNNGGELIFGASWSLDANGLTEQCAFFTTEGEVAVYQGSNPGDANDWTRVGVYKVGQPRGQNAWIRAGGDLVIATDVGFVPLSQAIQRDYAALSPVAVSYPIEDEWNKAVRDRTSTTWQCQVWPTKQMVVVAPPPTSGQPKETYVANARTGAWAKYTGWEPTCLKEYSGRLFFGTTEGKVIEAEVTGYDQSAPYTATVVPLFDNLKAPASIKTGLQARSVFRSPSAVTANLSLQADYTVNLPAAPDATGVPSGSQWGSAVWGQSAWGDVANITTDQNWRSVPGAGYALSVATQVTSGANVPPNVELIQTDLTYDLGDIGT